MTLVPDRYKYEDRQNAKGVHGHPQFPSSLDILRIWSIFSVIFVVVSFLVKLSAMRRATRMLRIDLVQLEDLQKTDI